MTADEGPGGNDRVRRAAGLGYQAAFGLVSIVLLLSRTHLSQIDPYGWLLFGIFLLVGIICEELNFSVGPGLDVGLGGLFSSAVVLTLGFNGVWVPVLANLYWFLRAEWRYHSDAPSLPRVTSGLFNLSMTILPPWLGLFVYQDLLAGDVHLADMQGNVVPALAFVLVQWAVLLAGVLPLVVIAERGLAGAERWLVGVLTGVALAIYVPILFSPAVAVILNSHGLGFFIFVAAGLLGISYMAQRLARSLSTEQQRVEELTALNALSSDIIHSSPGVDSTAQLIGRHVPRLVPGADLELCLFDEEQPDQRMVVADLREGQARPARQVPMTPMWLWLREEHLSLHLPDVTAASLPFGWTDHETSELPGSLLLVPLLAAGPEDSEAERCIGGLLLSHPRPGALGPELLPSTTALANQLAAALENARLQREALAHERLEREMALARDIQASFLPEDVPHIKGWDFAASLEPARQVSGDFYDFIPLEEGRIGLLIADVADKGMPAALYMALARTLIRAHAPDYPEDPAACLIAANDQILSDTRSDLFVTVFYGILDPETGEMVYCSAGHNPPLHWDAKCWRGALLRAGGMALGVLPGVELENQGVRLEPGDLVVLYTDGYTEAHGREYEQFGMERFQAAVAASAAHDALEVHDRVRRALGEFVGDAPQSDDLTLVVLGREGAGLPSDASLAHT